jgi:hypothetical protein
VKDGRIVEHWGLEDNLTRLRQVSCRSPPESHVEKGSSHGTRDALRSPNADCSSGDFGRDLLQAVDAQLSISICRRDFAFCGSALRRRVRLVGNDGKLGGRGRLSGLVRRLDGEFGFHG